MLCKSIILAHAGPDIQLTVRQNITWEVPGLLPHPKYSKESVSELITYLTNFAGLVLERYNLDSIWFNHRFGSLRSCIKEHI